MYLNYREGRWTGTEAGALGPQRHILSETTCVVWLADLEHFLFEKEKE